MAYRVSLPDTYAFEVGAAQGGAGILKAIHRETDRRFAVKSYRPPAWLTAREAEAYCDRVRATVERLVCVDHPGLAPVFDIVEHDGWVHVLRDFVPGASLAARLAERGPLPAWDVRYMASRVASAIDALAEAGMAHGSIGPRNIILAEDGSVVLTDAMLADVTRAFTIGVRWARFAPRSGAGGDLRGLAVSTLQALTGCAAAQARSAASAAYELAPSAREAFRRALKNDHRAFRSASDFAASLCPDTGLPLFQQVWRPAAAAGLLGALATLGGNATSDTASRAEREAASRRFVQIVPATVKVIVRPRIVLNDEDQQALRLAIRRHGAAILAHPAVAEVFKLSDAQKAEIGRCLSEQREKIEQLVSGAADGKVLDTASPMSALRDQTQTRVLRVLNDTQRELWDETTSAPAAPNEPLI